MTPSHLLSAAVAAILTASRPAGLPSTVQIAAQGATAPLVAPHLVAASTGGDGPHPSLLKLTLTLTLTTRADEQDTATAGTWHQAAVDFLNANPAALHATLLPHGYTLLRCHPTAFSDTEQEKRARAYEQQWTVWLRAAE